MKRNHIEAGPQAHGNKAGWLRWHMEPVECRIGPCTGTINNRRDIATKYRLQREISNIYIYIYSLYIIYNIRYAGGRLRGTGEGYIKKRYKKVTNKSKK